MRAWSSLIPLLLLGACQADPAPAKPTPDAKSTRDGEPEATDVQTPAKPATEALEPKLGAHTSSECSEAMAALSALTTGADARTSWAGPLEDWVRAAGTKLDRTDADLIEESVARYAELTDNAGRERELTLVVTQIRTVALLEARRLLTAASDVDPSKSPALERARLWDDAYCAWNGALRPLAVRADALPKRGGEDWEATILDGFTDGRAALADPSGWTTSKASRQIVEKGSYAVAYRLILAAAEDPSGTAASEAVGLLDMLDDRIADRNGPGLARMRVMFNGDPSGIELTVVERELAVAFTKRARKYCDKAVAKAELGTSNAIAETWEGVLYSKVILPSMRDALADHGFDADAYAADWQSYLEAVESADADTAADISARLVEWNCAYQDHLGIAACTASDNELQ